MRDERPEAPAASAKDDARVPRPGVLGAVVAALSLLAFAPAIGGTWIYDDNPLIKTNVFVHSLRFWPRWLTTEFWDLSEELKRFGARMVYWRPAVTASYGVDWWLGGGSPVVFHAVNLVWHAIASLLAFATLRRWTGAWGAAFIAALLFAVHPTKAESVAWIAGRTDVLCAVGVLVAALGVSRRLRRARGGVPLEIVGTVFAYMTKEQAIVLPVVYAVEAWVAAGRPAIDAKLLRPAIRAAWPQALVAGCYLVVRAVVLPIRSTVTPKLALATRIAEPFETLGRFTDLTLVPHDMSVQQGIIHMAEGRIASSTAYVVVGVVAAIAASAAAWYARRRLPLMTVGVAFYILTLAPTLNIVPTDMATMLSERFLYLPLLGIAAVAAGLGAFAWSKAASRGARVAIALTFVAATIALGAESFARAEDYLDADAFWARELRLHPDSMTALDYYIERSYKRRHFQAAARYLRRARELQVHYDPDLELPHLTLAAVDLASVFTRDLDREGLLAISQFYDDVLTKSSGVAELHIAAGTAMLSPALAQRSKRTHSERLRVKRADILSRLGDDVGALALADQAVAMCARCSDVGSVAALVHARAGDYAGANALLDEVARALDEEAVAELRKSLATARGFAAMAADAPEGPLQEHARARELGALEAWGRAYLVLAPYVDAIEKAPTYALGFAELAWRAGAVDVADRVLRANVPATQIEPLKLEWSTKMGWIDDESGAAR